MDESHHCNVLQLLLKSEGWMNFKNDPSHVPECQVTILNSRSISQQSSSHSALVSVSAHRSGSRKRTARVHELDCSKYKLSPLFSANVVQQWKQLPDGQRRHGFPTDTFYSIVRFFFFNCLFMLTPWSVRQGAGKSQEEFGNSKVIVIFLMFLNCLWDQLY